MAYKVIKLDLFNEKGLRVSDTKDEAGEKLTELENSGWKVVSTAVTGGSHGRTLIVTLHKGD